MLLPSRLLSFLHSGLVSPPTPPRRHPVCSTSLSSRPPFLLLSPVSCLSSTAVPFSYDTKASVCPRALPPPPHTPLCLTASPPPLVPSFSSSQLSLCPFFLLLKKLWASPFHGPCGRLRHPVFRRNESLWVTGFLLIQLSKKISLLLGGCRGQEGSLPFSFTPTHVPSHLKAAPSSVRV